MPSMLETLLAQGVQRKDNRRLTAILRPLPIKQRDVFDLIVAQGREPSFQGVLRSVELKGADPRALTFVMLGRWPTATELDALPQPYNAKHHLRDLLQSPEFRRTFVRRLLDAFPDRRRLLFVHIPRSGGAQVMVTAANRHPIMPQHIADTPRMSLADVLTALGESLYRFNSASTVVVASPRLAPFLTPPQPAQDAADMLRWNLIPPPYRAGDTLFTTIREPRGLILSHINATARAAGKDAARQALRETSLRNPICNALGDGTAETAIAACRASGIELIGLGRQTDWIRTAFSVEPDPPPNPSVPVLRAEDLSADDIAHLDSLIAEDLQFHARFAARFDPTQVSAISGSAL